MKKTSFAIALACSLASASLSYAAVTLSVNLGTVRTDLGAPVSLGSVGILVADFSNDGLVNAFNTTLTVGSFLGGGTDDQILSVVNAISFGGTDRGYDFVSTFEYSGSFAANDHLYMLWFPSISSANAVVSNGTKYGQFRSSVADTSSSIAWTAPADGTYNLFSYGTSLGGSPAISDLALSATLTASAIPEPSTYAGFAGLAILGFAAMRRRRA